MAKRFIVTLLFVLSINISYSQGRNHEMVLANCVLSSLRAGNDSLILQCIPSRMEFDLITETAKAFSDKNAVPVDSLIKNISIGSLKNVNKIYAIGQRNQINWSLVKIDSVSVNVLKPEFDRIEKANIVVFLSQDEIRFSLKLTRCLFVTDSWRIMDIIVWKD